MVNQNKYFKLFANCIPTKGANRSIICDLQRKTIRYIPNLLYEVLHMNVNMSISQLKKHFNNEFDKGIDLYFNKLIEEEYGFYTNEPNSFPDIELTWDSPFIITNAIVEINNELSNNTIFKQLDELGCIAVEIRFCFPLKLLKIQKILELTQYGRLKSIELFLKYSDEITSENLGLLCKRNGRIKKIIVYDSPHNKKVNNKLKGLVSIEYINSSIDFHNCCGYISEKFFSVNIFTFTEAQLYNTCLNRKISIDYNGNIRNCPSMKNDYGNISSIPLNEVILKEDFKKFWKINKDMVDICKVCEYRYICTDCRAFIADESNIYSKPSRCVYDPYKSIYLNLE